MSNNKNKEIELAPLVVSNFPQGRGNLQANKMAMREAKGPNYIALETGNPALRKELKGLIELAKPQSILTWHITLMFDRIFTIFYIITMAVIHVFKG